MTSSRKRTPAQRADGHVRQVARRRGRPQMTSREDIIAGAISILREDPEAGVSLNRVARHLGLTPMALYTYFANRDELLQAVSSRLLEGLVIDVPAGAGWPVKIDLWARAMREYFLRYPHLMHVLQWRGHISAAWLKNILLLFEALADAGFRGREQAQMAVWILHSIMGAVLTEIAERRSGHRFSTRDFAGFDSRQRLWLGSLYAYGEEHGHSDQAFDYDLAQLMDGIAARRGRRPVRQSPGARRRPSRRARSA